ncbi:MAG TPA: hypothetical protein VIF81_04440 [Pyrinomonadaceae bacterium]|jgi:hypothetical protein
MKRRIKFLTFAIFITMLVPAASMAQRRVVVRRPVLARHPIVRRPLVFHPGHPLRRRLPADVVVRAARRTVVVNRPLVFLPAVTWTRTVVPLPARDRLVWQDSETISRDEEWVDTNFGIDASGDALFLDIDGKAKLNFAEVTFENGEVQVVDFNEKTHDTGVYKLLDFADGRHVATVRILAKSESDDTKLSVYLSK